MFSYIRDVVDTFFGPNPALKLPENLQTILVLESVKAMGWKGKAFVAKMNELSEKDSSLLNIKTIKLFIDSGKHFDTVFQAFNLIYEQEKPFATVGTLQSLVKMKSKALIYAQACINSHEDLSSLFPFPVSLKEVQKIGALRTLDAPVSHMISLTEKDHKNALFGVEKKKERHKPWVSKTTYDMDTEQIKEFQALYRKKIDQKPTTRYASQSTTPSFFAALVSRVELTNHEYLKQEDIDKALHYFYFAVMDSFDPHVKPPKERYHEVLLTREDVLAFINHAVDCYEPSDEQRNPGLYAYKQRCQAGYVESFLMIEEKVLTLIKLLKAGRINEKTRHILEELDNGCLFPMRRGAFLKESAAAQVEVMAQELKRALCPFHILGRNPYPKYRVSTPNTREKRAISIIPAIPVLYISSEEIDFSDNFFRRYLNASEDKVIFKFKKYHHESRSSIECEKELTEIPGIGTACLFAKFLGDKDFKLGNFGVNIDRRSKFSHIATSLDAGLAFSREPTTPPLFNNGHEVLINPKLEMPFAYNFFYSYHTGKPKLQCDTFLESASKDSGMIKENFITAFNLAFISPAVYEIFMKQYLSVDNPWITMYYWDKILSEHLSKEQQALYHAFETNPAFLNYFLESRLTERNIFFHYQQLVTQIEGFCFYKKHRLKDTPEFHANPEIVESCFLDFITKQCQQGATDVKQNLTIQCALWDPSQVTSLKGIEQLSAVERGQKLKEKVEEILKVEPVKQEPAVIFSSTSGSSWSIMALFKKKT